MKRIGIWWVPDKEELQNPALEKGGWQIDHLEAALAHVQRWDCAVDGGAHIGTWTLAMAQRFNTVVAFEPAPDTFKCLRKNTKGSGRSIYLEQLALGDRPRDGFAMAEDTKYQGGNTGGRYLVPKADGDVRTIKLDDYGLPGRLGFLKLDVEGYEYFALRGSERTLLRDRPVVLIEDKPRMAHRFGLAPHQALSYCHDLGMRDLGNVGADLILGW